MGLTPPWSAGDGGVWLAVRVTPRSARDGIEGVRAEADGRSVLAVRLTAPPVDGEANAALIAYLAKALRVRKADIAIRSGETGRTKRLHITGDAQALAARLAALVDTTSS